MFSKPFGGKHFLTNIQFDDMKILIKPERNVTYVLISVTFILKVSVFVSRECLTTAWRRGRSGRTARCCCRRNGKLKPNCSSPTNRTNCSRPKTRSKRWESPEPTGSPGRTELWFQLFRLCWYRPETDQKQIHLNSFSSLLWFSYNHSFISWIFFRYFSQNFQLSEKEWCCGLPKKTGNHHGNLCFSISWHYSEDFLWSGEIVIFNRKLRFCGFSDFYSP